jgi:hypothetical protein
MLNAQMAVIILVAALKLYAIYKNQACWKIIIQQLAMHAHEMTKADNHVTNLHR